MSSVVRQVWEKAGAGQRTMTRENQRVFVREYRGWLRDLIAPVQNSKLVTSWQVWISPAARQDSRGSARGSRLSFRSPVRCWIRRICRGLDQPPTAPASIYRRRRPGGGRLARESLQTKTPALRAAALPHPCASWHEKVGGSAERFRCRVGWAIRSSALG